MAGSLDTNILLRLILGDIKPQQDSAEALIESTKGRLSVADIVFVELEYALAHHYQFTRTQVADVLSMTASHPKLNCNTQHLLATLEIYKSTAGVSFTDIALSVYADKNEAEPLYTFDVKLAKKLPNAQLL